MKNSDGRIITSHCGSLPRPEDIVEPLRAKDGGEAYDREGLAARVRQSVVDVVAKQRELGVDVVNDGEHSKSSFSTYARGRIGGITPTSKVPDRKVEATRDMIAFPEVYREMKIMFGARRSAQVKQRGMVPPAPDRSPTSAMTRFRPTSPI